MTRVGIFIDGLQGSIPSSFREKLTAAFGAHPEVAFCVEEEHLTAPEALGRMVKRLEEKEVESAVIVGGSPKRYESSFLRWGFQVPINPYRLAVANVREQALWAAEDEASALRRAKGIIGNAIRMVSAGKPVDGQSLALKPEVLVIGGGIVGIAVCLELARSGNHVSLVEREAALGGKARELRRFYNRAEDPVPWVDARIDEVRHGSNVTIYLQAQVKRVEGQVGRFRATLTHRDGRETVVSPSAIVVATGCAVESAKKPIGSNKRVIPLSAMERLVAEATGPVLSLDGKTVRTVSFLLDGVNEDLKIDSIHALKQALLLREPFACQVAVLCKDLKVAADGMERLYREARDKGVLFFKYEILPEFTVTEDEIRVDLVDTSAIRKEQRWPVTISSDLVVVGEALVPDPETARLSEVLRIHLGDRGRLMEDNPQLLRVRTNRRGIFVAGACRFPEEISEAMIEAGAAAQEVIALLSRGVYPYDLAVAEVDPKKCAVCYTCPRLCPHAAITVEKYAEANVYRVDGTASEATWGAAKVDAPACHGCGICVAECPARAITLRHQGDEQVYAQMGLP